MRTAIGLLVSGALFAACGPENRRPGAGEPGDGVDAPPPVGVEACTNALDDDGDGLADCSDPDCSGIDGCPVCGAVDSPEATPLALPDGVNSGTMCSTDAQCTDPTAPNCVSKECHASYVSTLDFVGFPDGATLTDPSKLLKVCVKMEHSWLRDIQIELLTPGGAVFILGKWYDRDTLEEVFLGTPVDTDETGAPVPGVGMDYCWTPTATTEMINSMTGVSAPNNGTLPAGDYKPAAPWTALTGSPLNGPWAIRVTDLWEIDNGFLFDWQIKFNPNSVADCSGPIIN